MQLDGLGLLQAVRGASMGILIIHSSVAAKPTLVGLHMTLAYGSLCTLVAGMQAHMQTVHTHVHSSWGLRAWQCVVCSCLFCACTAQDVWSAVRYILQLQPWMYVFAPPAEPMYMSVLFVSCVLWVELGVLAFAWARVPLPPRTGTVLLCGSLLVSVGLLFVPQLIAGVALHPMFRMLDALAAYTTYGLQRHGDTGERDGVVVASQAWCILYWALLVFSVLGLVPVQQYTVSVAGKDVTALEVDLIVATYTPLLIVCVLVDMEVTRPLWQMTLQALQLVDSMFVPALVLGPVLCTAFVQIMPSSHDHSGVLPLLLALFSTFVVILYVTVLLDEAYNVMVRAVKARSQGGGYVLQKNTEEAIGAEETA